MCVCVCVCVCVYLCQQLVSIGYPIVKIRHLIESESTTNKQKVHHSLCSNKSTVLTYMCLVLNFFTVLPYSG